jgi:hemerythrin-like domain-containing protein
MLRTIAADIIEQHRNMERVLLLIRLQVDSLRHTHDRPGLHLLGNAIRYMEGFPTHVHDPVEEMLFAKLCERLPTAAPLCTRLSRQRNSFFQLQSALNRHVEEAKDGDPHAIVMLKHAGVAYCLEYADHIRVEEHHVLPNAESALDLADWRSLDREAGNTSGVHQYPELKRYDNLYDFLMSNELTPKPH